MSAALPVINSLRDLLQTGDQVKKITGCTSGTGYVLAREAAHNLARICCASGSRDLARQIMRSMPV